MAQAQVGNEHGVPAVSTGATAIANVAVTMGAAGNTFNVGAGNVRKLRVGQAVDITDRATGAVLAANRTITVLNTNGDVTVDGATFTATTAHSLYSPGTYAAQRSNLNGGRDTDAGFADSRFLTVEDMRQRLQAIDAGFYTDRKLNTMTHNDLVYAIRVADHAGTIK